MGKNKTQKKRYILKTFSIITLLVFSFIFVANFSVVYATSDVIGDINGDGQLDIKDIMLCANHVAEFDFNLTDKQIKLADVNKDGKVNVKDVTFMQVVNIHGQEFE